MTTYEREIEIWMKPVYLDKYTYIEKLNNLRRRPGNSAQESSLIDHLRRRASQGSTGYVGSSNCVFSLLYGVFGADVIEFLFGRCWHPLTMPIGQTSSLHPFKPTDFLQRLAVLEDAARKLKNGSQLPVRLQETEAFIRPWMGPSICWFYEEQHRILFDASLQELRNFGELGLSLEKQGEKLMVGIQIFE